MHPKATVGSRFVTRGLRLHVHHRGRGPSHGQRAMEGVVMERRRTVAAVWNPCAVCALVDVLTLPDTDPATAVCRECLVDSALAELRADPEAEAKTSKGVGIRYAILTLEELKESFNK